MSRVGKAPVNVPAGTKVDISADGFVKAEGKNGKLEYQIPRGVEAKLENGQVLVTIDAKRPVVKASALHGLVRTLIGNMVTGVTTGFKKELDIVGVGYRAAVKGKVLNLNLGFSHPIDFDLPEGVTAKVEKNTHIVIEGADKAAVGEVAAKIRAFRPPEPYQGKGVKYSDEHIVRKQGKSAGAK